MSMHKCVKITNSEHINHTYMFHYLLSIKDGLNITRNGLFDYLAIQKHLVMTAAQHNITTVDITTPTYERYF